MISARDLASIYVAEFPFVLGCLRKFGVRSSDALDLAQEVFARVVRAAPSAAVGHPRPWLMSFASRVAYEFRRTSSRQAYPEVDEPTIPHRPDEILEQRQLDQMVQVAISRIHPTRRVVFVLSQIEGIEIVEIARRLAIPKNTAYSRLRLARQDFASEIGGLSALLRIDETSIRSPPTALADISKTLKRKATLAAKMHP